MAKPKIIDPSDPRFDITKFEFEDYIPKDQMQFERTIRQLLPVGTTRADAEKILIGYGHAEITFSHYYPQVKKTSVAYRKVDDTSDTIFQCRFWVNAEFGQDERLQLVGWRHECDRPQGLPTYPFGSYEDDLATASRSTKKTIDPKNPLFDIKRFRLEDYSQMRLEGLRRVIQEVFPVGTPKEKVEKVLLDYSGAEIYSTPTRYGSGSDKMTTRYRKVDETSDPVFRCHFMVGATFTPSGQLYKTSATRKCDSPQTGPNGKVIEPTNSQFDPTKFKFEDYVGISMDQLRRIFRQLLPVGTPRSHIENVLADHGGATIVTDVPRISVNPPMNDEEYAVAYRKTDTTPQNVFNCTWGVKAVYSKVNKLTRDIDINHGCDGP